MGNLAVALKHGGKALAIISKPWLSLLFCAMGHYCYALSVFAPGGHSCVTQLT